MGYFSESDIKRQEENSDKEIVKATKEQLQELRKQIRQYSQEYDRLYGYKKEHHPYERDNDEQKNENIINLTKRINTNIHRQKETNT